MKKIIDLTIVIVQKDIDSIEQKIQFTTTANFYKKNDTHYITYKEPRTKELEGAKVTIKILKNVVSIIRFGENSSNLKFEQGKKYISNYKTNYGMFEITISPKNVFVDINDLSGSIELNYDVKINNQDIGSNSFMLRY